MDPMTLNVLIAIGGAIATVVAHKMGIQIPGIQPSPATPGTPATPAPVVPMPSPAPAPVAPVDGAKPLEAALTYLHTVQAGVVKATDLDKTILASLKVVVDAILSPNPSK